MPITRRTNILGVVKSWTPHERLPVCTVRELFSRFLDITTPPTPNLLQHFASIATDEDDQRRLTLLATVLELNTNRCMC